MKKKIFSFFFLIFLSYTNIVYSVNDEIYKKIDLFGEVLDKINKEYVDEVNQNEMMDSAINGVLQSLDPYSAYMSPELFKEMQTDTRGEFGGLGIEIGMEAGVSVLTSYTEKPPVKKLPIFSEFIENSAKFMKNSGLTKWTQNLR